MPRGAAPCACSVRRVDRGSTRPRPSRELGAVVADDGSLRVPIEGAPSDSLATVMTVAADAAGTVVTARRSGAIDIPFFGWFFQPLTRIAGNRSAKYALADLRHDLEGGPQPKAPAGVIGLPTVPFTHEQTLLLASASAAVAVVSFASALFGQLADPIADTFGVSDAKLSVALALTRGGRDRRDLRDRARRPAGPPPRDPARGRRLCGRVRRSRPSRRRSRSSPSRRCCNARA